MKWMRERDLLIAQTMAFVQSVTGKKPEAEATGATSLALPPLTLPSLTLPAVETSESAPAVAPTPDIKAELAVSGALAEPAKPAPVVRPDLRDDFQSEIKARVANFRAHQERFSREREAYCSATMARVHAVLQESPPPPPGK
jgi:hypothetical protein